MAVRWGQALVCVLDTREGNIPGHDQAEGAHILSISKTLSLLLVYLSSSSTLRLKTFVLTIIFSTACFHL